MPIAKKRRVMKLYVWTDVLTDYTSGIMFALAPSVDHARMIISRDMGCSGIHADLLKEPDVYPVTKAAGFHVWGGG